jgi:hypothetical protein
VYVLIFQASEIRRPCCLVNIYRRFERNPQQNHLIISNIADLQLIPVFFKELYLNNFIVKANDPVTNLDRNIGFPDFKTVCT